jgi:phage gp36-like protein
MAVKLEYVSLDELEDVMMTVEQAEATDDNYGSGATINGNGPKRDDQMVRRFLKRAENMADHYVGTRYDLPIAEPTPMFKYTILSIARYMLDERGDGDVSESVTNSYNMAISWLEDIRDEVSDLQGENTETISDYYGEREGGTFGSDTFNDKSTAFTGEPFPA